VPQQVKKGRGILFHKLGCVMTVHRPKIKQRPMREMRMIITEEKEQVLIGPIAYCKVLLVETATGEIICQ
jgi:hypothetical protein